MRDGLGTCVVIVVVVKDAYQVIDEVISVSLEEEETRLSMIIAMVLIEEVVHVGNAFADSPRTKMFETISVRLYLEANSEVSE